MPPKSIKPFVFILVAQAISIFGSSLTAFALGIWIYKEVGNASIYAIIAVANSVPMVLLSPFAGTIVDRIHRKTAIVLSQTVSLLIACGIMLLYWQESLVPWHIVALVALNSVFVAFVMPAISATIPLMVPSNQLTRANGMIALSFGLIQLFSPALAGFVYYYMGLELIILIDIATFIIGIVAIAVTFIPQPHNIHSQHEPLWSSLKEGWRFISSNPSLRGTIGFYALIVAILMSMAILTQPLFLTLFDEKTMGTVMSFAGSGMLLGSIWMIFMRDVKYHMPIIFTATIIASIACILTPMFTTPILLALGGFAIMSCYPIFEANHRAILQRKIDPAILGRVIGWRNFALGITQSVLVLSAGFIADHYFEPHMIDGGMLNSVFEPIYGTGKGRGLALFLSCTGVIMLICTLCVWFYKPVREMDTLLDDHIEPEETFEAPITIKKTPRVAESPLALAEATG